MQSHWLLPEKEQGYWSVKRDPREQSCFSQVPKVILSQEVDLKVRLLLKKVSTEWLGYLCGQRENGDFFIDDLVIPEQRVTPSSVDGVQPVPNFNILGSIHSHPFAGKPSASGTDVEYVLSNHDLSIIVNTSGEYTCYGKIKARCGIVVVEELEVELRLPELKGWLKEASARIKQAHPESHFRYYGGGVSRRSLMSKETLPPNLRDFGGGFGD